MGQIYFLILPRKKISPEGLSRWCYFVRFRVPFAEPPPLAAEKVAV